MSKMLIEKSGFRLLWK